MSSSSNGSRNVQGSLSGSGAGAAEKRRRGRFAPSPTGPLHFGSLVAALGSWLDARASGSEWLVRMENVDRPRELPGAADAILRALESCSLHWDGTVMFQSRRNDAYAAAMSVLDQAGHLFPCSCTRREIADSITADTLAPEGQEVIYPGTCRNGLAPGRAARAWRVRVPDETIQFDDRIQGRCSQCLNLECGDFVIRRADELFAYQLAVVVDDAEQGITDVVRGADLLTSTPRQIYLQHRLGYPTPTYAHLPVAINAAGEKLSKQTLAAALDTDAPSPTMVRALQFLGQSIADPMTRATPQDILAWALEHWDMGRVPRHKAIPAP
jgi:glutamyl-Q tRNA(Asp) synthetase